MPDEPDANVSISDVREALGLPREGTPPEIAAAFAKSVGFKAPSEPETIEYLNLLLSTTLGIIGTGSDGEASEASAVIMGLVFAERSPEMEASASADLGTTEHLNTFFFDFFALDGYEDLKKAGLVHGIGNRIDSEND